MSESTTQSASLIDSFDRRVERRLQRRQFFRNAGGLGLGLVGGTLISACGGGSGSSVSAASAPTDAEILNFALNLEYLESQFYTYATTGAGLPASMTAGVGTMEFRPGRRSTRGDTIRRHHASRRISPGYACLPADPGRASASGYRVGAYIVRQNPFGRTRLSCLDACLP